MIITHERYGRGRPGQNRPLFERFKSIGRVQLIIIIIKSLFLFAFLFIICNSFLNIEVIVALIYKILIVALIREKKEKKKIQTRGGKTTLRYTYKYIYVTLRFLYVTICNIKEAYK